MDLVATGIFLEISPHIPSQSILTSSSRQADEINRIINYFFLAAGFILLLVAGLTAYILFRFRQNKNEHKTLKELNTKWEIGMIGVPAILVSIFLYFSISTMNRINPGVEGKIPDVIITAHQWWWQADYTAGNVITSNEIHLPAGKTLLLKLVAADVIHDWWVPQFGNKMDIIPYQDNYLWLTIKEPGEYYGICSEFCGYQHANMRIKVVAQTEKEFNRWLKENQEPAVADTLFATGEQLFMAKTCGNCHRINGTAANGNTGPDLTHIGSRTTLLAGLLVNNPENLKRWIQHPQQIKPGAYMRDFFLNDSTANAIAAYLNSLK